MIHDDTTYIDLYAPNLLGPWESEISSKIVENRFFCIDPNPYREPCGHCGLWMYKDSSNGGSKLTGLSEESKRDVSTHSF